MANQALDMYAQFKDSNPDNKDLKLASTNKVLDHLVT